MKKNQGTGKKNRNFPPGMQNSIGLTTPDFIKISGKKVLDAARKSNGVRIRFIKQGGSKVTWHRTKKSKAELDAQATADNEARNFFNDQSVRLTGLISSARGSLKATEEMLRKAEERLQSESEESDKDG